MRTDFLSCAYRRTNYIAKSTIRIDIEIIVDDKIGIQINLQIWACTGVLVWLWVNYKQ